jgi:hypothetical protein
MTREEIDKLIEALCQAETGAIILEPQSAFNGGIVGYDGTRLIYEYFATLTSMLSEYGAEGALDWFSYNTLRSLPYMGDKAPIVWDGQGQEVMYPVEQEVEIECYLGLQNSLQQIQYKENGEEDGDLK